jgi:hypothetical protein
MHVGIHARALRAATAGLAVLLVAACSKENQNEAAGDVTPGAAATATTAVSVADIDLGRAVANSRVTNETDDFSRTDTVYASVHTTGSAPSTTLMARWTYEDGQVVQESSQAIAPTGDAYTEFHISKPGGLPAGKYKVEVFVDNKSAGTKDFEVK